MSWTSEQLADLRTYAAENRVVDSDCAMSLIAEVERLRARDATICEGNAKLIAEVERLRAWKSENQQDITGATIHLLETGLVSKDTASLEDAANAVRAEGERLRADRCIRSAEADGERIRALGADVRGLQNETENLRTELDAVLSDWNAIVKASGSPTNGEAVGHVAAMRAEVERLRAERDKIKGHLVRGIGSREFLERQGRHASWINASVLDIFDAIESIVSKPPEVTS